MTNYMRNGLDKTRKVDSKSERMRVLILFLKKEGEYVPDFSILTNNIDMYLEGFKYTVMSSVIALIGSFILGVILAVMRIAPISILNWIGISFCGVCKKYSTRINCIYILFCFTCNRITLNGFVAGTVTLTAYTALLLQK